MRANSFRDLVVWQRAVDLVVVIYKTTDKFPPSEMYGLSSQMRRASVSISSNIAEGFKRVYKLEKTKFYNIAEGSAVELDSQAEVSKRLGFITDAIYSDIVNRISEISRMLDGLIKSVKNR